MLEFLIGFAIGYGLFMPIAAAIAPWLVDRYEDWRSRR